MKELNIVAEPGKHDISMSRDFDAPREVIFKVITDPELVPQWWGPERYTTTVDRMEVKHGGTWRYVQRGPDGDEHAFRGVYHEVASPERLVYTFEYEGMPGHIALESIRLESIDGGTRVVFHDVFQSIEDRDGMYESGAEEGSRATMDRLEALLQKVRA